MFNFKQSNSVVFEIEVFESQKGPGGSIS